MSFFKTSTSPQSLSTLTTKRLYLRTPIMADFAQWSELRSQSRDFLQPWEPTWPSDDLTKASFRKRIRRSNRNIREGSQYPFFLFNNENDELLGGLNLSNVRRGVSQTTSMGYWMGASFAGNGFMKEAVARVCEFCFETLHLHRLEAACLPTNEPSKALLKKVGFSELGYAPSYLFINGMWQDHILFGKIRDSEPIFAKVLPQSEADGDKLLVTEASTMKPTS
ncbi:putative ribosomal N-acetyltransferase YdaF [Pseudovibrio axinellae]|uniref:Putative ribosomal N-acetyltransferase YdaF n=1 Tax=Pseudovibrio axinellae TaxID=989403 RepID=A0A165YEA1_9HYPH|nr:GNAT family protein [Pseudovibrio axinellae]KZL18767.1 putative ribosomal N-acetyltransferase YdaF [Pseudovibrio axinellae]SEP93566.1 [SSU ribosomal protein S5P]-alanine acetyltransferase [Pseudovibrio axinellae]